MGAIVKLFEGFVLSKEFDSFTENSTSSHPYHNTGITMVNKPKMNDDLKCLSSDCVSSLAAAEAQKLEIQSKKTKGTEQVNGITGSSSDISLAESNSSTASTDPQTESRTLGSYQTTSDRTGSIPAVSEECINQCELRETNQLKIFTNNNIFVSCSNLFKSNTTEIRTEEMTLLQMAEEFRTRQPDLWRKRENERKKRQEGSSTSKEKMDSFLDTYYSKQVRILNEKKEKETQEKFAIPKVFLQLTYHTFPTSTFEKHLNIYENLFENRGVFEKEHTEVLHFLPGVKHMHQKYNSEMHIAITQGKYLLNYLLERSLKFDTCSVKCYFYPGNNNHERTDNTQNIYVTLKGKARWEHAFILKDYTKKDLDVSYVMLVVTGKRNEETEVIGRTILAGKHAKIWDEKMCVFREPIDSEVIHWDEAVTKPFTTIHATAELTRPIAHNTTGIVVSLTQAFSNVEIKQ